MSYSCSQIAELSGIINLLPVTEFLVYGFKPVMGFLEWYTKSRTQIVYVFSLLVF